MATAIWTVTLDELANALRLSTQYGENNQFVVPLSSLSSSVVQQLADTLLQVKMQHNVGSMPMGEELRNWANALAPVVEQAHKEATNKSRVTSAGFARVTHTGQPRVTA